MIQLLILSSVVLSFSQIKARPVSVGDMMQCVKQKCPTQYAACVADTNCPKVLTKCQNKCGTSPLCWLLCLKQGGDQNAMNVAKCAQKQGCVKSLIDYEDEEKKSNVPQPMNFGDMMECVKQKCPTQYAACVADTNCPKVLTKCQNKCGTSPLCWLLCLKQGGDQNAMNVAKCAQKQGCVKSLIDYEDEEKKSNVPQPMNFGDMMECVKLKCPTQYAACVADTNCPKVLTKCQNKCGTSPLCWLLCLKQGGDQNAMNVAKCAQKQGCVKSLIDYEDEEKKSNVPQPMNFGDMMECVKLKCPTQYAACVADTNCPKVLTKCQNKCGTSPLCWLLCLKQGGDQNAMNVAKCAQKQGCVKSLIDYEDEEKKSNVPQPMNMGDMMECVKLKCPTQYAACVADTNCPKVLTKCQNKCGTSPLCWLLCLKQGGDQNAMNVAKCAQKQGCVKSLIDYEDEEKKSNVPQPMNFGDMMECVKLKCPTQYAACVADTNCPKVLTKCQNKCGTSPLCWLLCLKQGGDQNAMNVAKCAQKQGCVKSLIDYEDEEKKSNVPQPMNMGDMMECVKLKCPTQYAACVADTNCPKVLTKCQNKCGTSPLCWLLCLKQGGDQNAMNVAKCAQKQGCVKSLIDYEDEEKKFNVPQPMNMGDMMECVKLKCPTQYAACVADTNCPKVLTKCQNKCGTSPLCWLLCLKQGGDQNAMNVAKCAQKQGCVKSLIDYEDEEKKSNVPQPMNMGDMMECVKLKCPTQYAACVADTNCPKVLTKCQNKCGTSPLCWLLCLKQGGDQNAMNVAKCAQKQGCVKSLIDNEEEKKKSNVPQLMNPAPFLKCIKQKCGNDTSICHQNKICKSFLKLCNKIEKGNRQQIRKCILDFSPLSHQLQQLHCCINTNCLSQ